ncbi:MAG: hypothetical protein Pg6B_02020 [Candidatus Azobacteroides pseudotrichonymphae]|nr:MAG: hypothetical protein Pg6B_02020 [Candidatus Azobacteroides pseudotrichonymphae]
MSVLKKDIKRTRVYKEILKKKWKNYKNNILIFVKLFLTIKGHDKNTRESFDRYQSM